MRAEGGEEADMRLSLGVTSNSLKRQESADPLNLAFGISGDSVTQPSWEQDAIVLDLEQPRQKLRCSACSVSAETACFGFVLRVSVSPGSRAGTARTPSIMVAGTRSHDTANLKTYRSRETCLLMCQRAHQAATISDRTSRSLTGPNSAAGVSPNSRRRIFTTPLKQACSADGWPSAVLYFGSTSVTNFRQSVLIVSGAGSADAAETGRADSRPAARLAMMPEYLALDSGVPYRH